MTSFSLTSAPLLPPLIIDGRTIHTVRLGGTLESQGVLSLDPNPIALDRFGNAAKTGLMAFEPTPVSILESKTSPLPSPASPAAWRLFDLTPTQQGAAGAASLIGRLQLAVREGPCPLHRLLVLDKAGAIERLITLEPAP